MLVKFESLLSTPFNTEINLLGNFGGYLEKTAGSAINLCCTQKRTRQKVKISEQTIIIRQTYQDLRSIYGKPNNTLIMHVPHYDKIKRLSQMRQPKNLSSVYAHVYIHTDTLHYITLHYFSLLYFTLLTCYITSHHITVHYITLLYITLHYIYIYVCVCSHPG
jgi:hypothetical protein